MVLLKRVGRIVMHRHLARLIYYFYFYFRVWTDVWLRTVLLKRVGRVGMHRHLNGTVISCSDGAMPRQQTMHEKINSRRVLFVYVTL